MKFSAIPPDEMATYVAVQLAWIDEHADELNRSTEYYDLADRVNKWTRGVPSSELLQAISNLNLDAPHLRVERPHSMWVLLLEEVKAAAAVLRLADLPVGTRLRGLAPMGVSWEAIKTRDGVKPDGACPASEFVVTHAEHGDWWLPCLA